MPHFVRSRTPGKHELRVTHPRLAKAFYGTFETREKADQIGQQAIAALDAGGDIPAWLQRHPERPARVTVAQAILAYRNIRAVPASTQGILDTLCDEIGRQALAQIDYDWVEAWIRAMKLQKQLAPGTIRKKKGALSRVFDWLVRAHPLWLSANPLHGLPHGYSGYDENSRAELIRNGLSMPEDIERNRRIDRTEQAHILTVLERRVAQANTAAQRAEADAMNLMFQLALCTAMRMREIYTLTLPQIAIEQKTIFLDKTKNGDRRQVPLSKEARGLLQRSWPALDEFRCGNRLLPFWNGQLDQSSLRETTAEVSLLFSKLFAEAGSEDLHFHDTRHEAICRWVLESPVPITSEQLGRAAGMRDARTRQRYLSLRGSELAELVG